MTTTQVKLPGTLVLGAQKAGTTSLDAWLRLQPELALPRIKETHFLSEDERFEKGLTWYDAQFPKAGRSRVEVDPDYLSSASARSRAQDLFDPAEPPRLLAIFRAPLARARSHWRMTVRRGMEQRSFESALFESFQSDQAGDPLSWHHDYYGRGRYAAHLAAWQQALPGADVLTLTFEELVKPATRADTFERICRFIGVEDALVMPDFDAIKNPAGEARSGALNRILHRKSPLRSALGKLIPSQDLRLKIGVLMESLNTRPAAPKATAPEVHDPAVLAAMAQDVRDLGAAMQRDLSAWLVDLEAPNERVVA